MRKILWNITWLVIRPLLAVFCHFQISGVENLKKISNPVILASAIHANYIDGFVLSAAFPFNSKFFPIRYMAKKMRIFDKPILKTIFKAYGVYRVEYGIGIENALQESIQLIKNGETIGIFVEGKRSLDGEIGEVKPGAAYLALKTGLPILPIAISGTYRLNFMDFLFRRKNIIICFGEPFFAKNICPSYNNIDNSNEVKKEDVVLLTEAIGRKIRELLKKGNQLK